MKRSWMLVPSLALLIALSAFRGSIQAAPSIAGVDALQQAMETRGGRETFRTKPMMWMFNTPAFNDIKDDPGVHRFFGLPGEQVLVIGHLRAPLDLPSNWNALHVRSFTSFANMQRALSAPSSAVKIDAVLYDNEHWKFTPEEEQRDPARYTRMAAELAHQHGFRFISTPAANLAKVISPHNAQRYDAYLKLGLAADSARYADIYEIQAQGSQANIQRYTSFVCEAARQAREANPRVLVLAGISTNPNGQTASAQQILKAIESTRPFVDGYWFNVPRPSEYCPHCKQYRPDMAIDVFHHILEERKAWER